MEGEAGEAWAGEARARGLRGLRGPGGCGAPAWALLLGLAVVAATDTGDGAQAVRWRPVDVVLGCHLADGTPPGVLAGGGPGQGAQLVLRGALVPDDGTLDGLDGDVAPGDDPDILTLEASAGRVPVLGASALLHAECSGRAVACDVARCPGLERSCFEVQAWLPETGPALSLVLTGPEPGAPAGGSVKTAVSLQVSTHTPQLVAPLGAPAALACAFALAPGLRLLAVHWRLQSRGEGRLVWSWAAGQARGQAGRPGAELDPGHMQATGDATLTLPGLAPADEGAYVCQVTSSRHRAQQVVRLSVRAPPKVRLRVTQAGAAPTAVCDVSGHYPAHVEVTWTRQAPGEPPASVPGASFSSLRRNAVGTYSVSSTLRADAGPAGATYTCEVTHSALEAPLGASAWVPPPTERRAGPGLVLAGVVFLLLGLCWVLLWGKRGFFARHPKPPRYAA